MIKSVQDKRSMTEQLQRKAPIMAVTEISSAKKKDPMSEKKNSGEAVSGPFKSGNT